MRLSCINCSTAMTLSNRSGVEIDQCTRCKGMWPDIRDLEKIANMQNRYEDENLEKYHYDKDMTTMINISAENTKRQVSWRIYLTLAKYNEQIIQYYLIEIIEKLIIQKAK